MRNLITIEIILLIILQLNVHNANSIDKKKQEKQNLANKVSIPGYPKGQKTDSINKDDSSTDKINNNDKPNPTTGKATGSTFSQVAQIYYGLSQNDSYSNIYLQYPEPYNGWEEELCQNSGEQSPVNIPYETDFSIIKGGSNVEILSIDYNHLQSGIVHYEQNHMWGLGILDGGNIRARIDNNEHIFYLSEVHFHLNSEHRLQNKQYPVEMQLVHYSSNYRSNHEKLIISVLFDYSNNNENELLSELKVGLLQEIEFADFSEIVKKSNPFYYYKGGITYPPCSNNVHWIIFKDIHDMSYAQFERIKNWIENSNKYYYSTGYGNARGIKALNGRKIYYEAPLTTASKTLSNGNAVKDNYGEALVYKFFNIANILMITSFLFS
jgi:carbonic anhydrase